MTVRYEKCDDMKKISRNREAEKVEWHKIIDPLNISGHFRDLYVKKYGDG